ncbi:MAG: N-(5'-phosphoribosyl)anthranilate isomerase [Candidatus Epulonipiscioides saccharophilum]|nr:MAG: N-(5'-phosphoribosyl)anthranilate isomerase [Epulopiscium sp. AS2M-Bin001]
MNNNRTSKIKICGIKSIQDLEAINKYKPDYIGLIFADSKRRVTPEQALNIKNHLVDNISTVGVFVNEDVDKVAEIALSTDLHLIQLHGDEDALYIQKLKALTNKKIIKAVRVKDSLQILEADMLPCDFLLLDTFSQNSYGGVGQTFDYSLIPNMKHPYFLAGGLNIRNIDNAISLNPFALDINSGVEVNGSKNYHKIKEIILRCRN